MLEVDKPEEAGSSSTAAKSQGDGLVTTKGCWFLWVLWRCSKIRRWKLSSVKKLKTIYMACELHLKTVNFSTPQILNCLT